jgi:hypothetical protein
MSKAYLKIKIKSLAAEAVIIRKDERKHRTFARKSPAHADHHHALRVGLADHRKTIVRGAARPALLAYGFLRGRKYIALESHCYEEPDWDRVADNILTFSPETRVKLGNMTKAERTARVVEILHEWRDAVQKPDSKCPPKEAKITVSS